MIYGVGVDMVETRRVREAVERHGDAFAGRILAEAEWPAYRSARDPSRVLAKSFAAKEAFGKATGLGIRAPVTLRAFWVQRDTLGKPSFGFGESLGAWLAGRGITGHHLSLSDEGSLVIAFVTLEGTSP